MRQSRDGRWVLGLLFVSVAGVVAAQTVITEPKNKYTPAQDVQMGQDAAAQVEKELPILPDQQSTAYLERVGRRLLATAPANFQHPEFRYTFKIVDKPDINAFALPGGPTYFNRGMMLAAKNEGEVAGVLAHELSHVLLRHGTAQATKATPYAIGQAAGAILGAIIGGKKGQVIAQGSDLAIGTAFLRFSREYEKQADLLGTHLMARAGYDPRDMADMFRTIEEQGGSNAPEFLSSHPNPGNRYDYVIAEANALNVQNATHDTADFRSVHQRLETQNTAATTTPPAGRSTGVDTRDNVPYPSTVYRTYSAEGAFQVSVPDNWRQLPGTSGATFAPDNAYSNGNFTHGVEIGVADTPAASLRDANAELINSMRNGNPGLQSQSSRSTTVDGQPALETIFSNPTPTGTEAVRVVTTMPAARRLVYVVMVVPSYEQAKYSEAFAQILRSLKPVR